MSDIIIHNSHDSVFRSPFGAVERDTKISMALWVSKNLSAREVFIHQIKREISEEKLIMELYDEDNYWFRYKIDVCTENYIGLIFYYFSVNTSDRTYFYGNNPESVGGIGAVYDAIPPYFQITVYKNSSSAADWFKNSIVYQIFPDRFYKKNEWVKNPKPNTFIYANWEDDPFYIKDCNGKIQRWDFFGGNMEGIISKLSYLKELGIGTIYLNPIFEAASNHRYDTANYKNIDPMLGNEEDFRELCCQAEKLGIKIILDGVFSHTGSDSIYFNRYGKYTAELGAYQSKASKYFSWYDFEEYPDKYRCWWGVDALPNVSELEPSYLDYIIEGDDSVIAHWMQSGASGWRLDVADELPDEFIKRFKRKMKAAKADSILIGEVWEDASNKVSYGIRREYFYGEELDSVMNYPLRSIFIGFLTGNINAATAHRRIMSIYENYPREIFYSCLNLISSHDVPRILTVMENRYGNSETAIEALKLIIMLQMTFPGVPCIYYGDEAGLRGGSDPENRRTYPWGKENDEILSFYKDMIKLRTSDEVFIKGAFQSFYVEEEVYGFLRILNDKRAVILINRAFEEKQVFIDNLGINLILKPISGTIKSI